jgi:hypothetical protein
MDSDGGYRSIKLKVGHTKEELRGGEYCVLLLRGTLRGASDGSREVVKLWIVIDQLEERFSGLESVKVLNTACG